MKRRLSLLSLAFVFNPVSAFADEPKISGSLTLTSDDRFRGLSQDARAITPQAELDWSGSDGWSAGAFASKVDFEDHEHTSVEVDLLAGKHFAFGLMEVDLNAYYYAYPDHDPSRGRPSYSTLEGSGKVGRQWRAFRVSGTVAWSPNFLANGQSWDAELGASYQISAWLSMSTHAGQQREKMWDSRSVSGFPYTYGDVGLTATAEKWSFDLRYTLTSLSRLQCLTAIGGAKWCQGGFVLSLSYAMGNGSDG